MKRNGLLLSLFLVFGVYASVNMAYGGNSREHDDRHEARKADSKEHEDRHEEMEGRTALTTSAPHAVKLSNLSNKPLEEIEIRFGGKDRTDFRQTNNCGEKLAGNASCVINVTFAPRTPGAKTATLEVHSSSGDQIVYLSGTGI